MVTVMIRFGVLLSVLTVLEGVRISETGIGFTGNDRYSHIRQSEFDMFSIVDIKSVSGIKKIRQGYIPGMPSYRIRKPVSGLQFPSHVSKQIRNNIDGSLTLHFLGKQSKRSTAVLFSVDVAGRPEPFFRLSSEIKSKKLKLQYTTKTGRHYETTFGNPFVNHKSWHQVALVVWNRTAKLFIGCDGSIEENLQGMVSFEWPINSVISLLQDADGNNSFKGRIQKAELVLRSIKSPPWICNETEKKPAKPRRAPHGKLQAPELSDTTNRVEPSSPKENVETKKEIKPPKPHYTVKEKVDLQIATDVLTRDNWRIIEKDIFELLESSPQHKEYKQSIQDLKAGVLSMQKEISTLKQQNAGLSRRINHLETCECQKPKDPCDSSPCLNGGTCISDLSFGNYTCVCDKYFIGEFCETILNVCLYPRAAGRCSNITKIEYFYNITSQRCEKFIDTDCDDSVNRFSNMAACREQCMVGDCCHRTLTTLGGSYVYTDVTCETRDRKDCQSIMTADAMADTQTEVISFKPGYNIDIRVPTEQVGCIVGNATYNYGENFRLGCQQCHCKHDGSVDCKCSATSVRKDIRELNADELFRFRAAVRFLSDSPSGNVWEGFADLYSQHIAHANRAPFFLPWHRIFLRQMEQKLQEIDCTIALPYYDFSTDAGNISASILWQKEYLGDFATCSHNRKAWSVCANRLVSSSILLPSAVELSLALASQDYLNVSIFLQSYSSLLHEAIGGVMVTVAAPLDPAFYLVHAFIDLQWDRWQHRDEARNYLSNFADISMKPFNVRPSQVLDLKNDLCVLFSDTLAAVPTCNVQSFYEELKLVEFVLSRQPSEFLQTIPRSCDPVKPVSMIVSTNLGLTSEVLITSGPNWSSGSISELSRQTCFDIEGIVNSVCPCSEEIAICEGNPCGDGKCESHAMASCHINLCGKCTAVWTGDNGNKVNCTKHVACQDELGISHDDGSWWHSMDDACQNCTCNGGTTVCQHVECPLVACTHPVKRSGICCAECADCFVEGEIIAEGSLVATDDPCSECVCVGGNMLCEHDKCKCYHKGRVRDAGETFTDGHPCINCTCELGQVRCERLDLKCAPACPHPARVWGGRVCCPVCDNCEFEGGYYLNGENFTRTLGSACYQCDCQDGRVSCEIESCPPVRCAYPERQEGSCCLRCPRSCVIGNDIMYEEGETWVDAHNPCTECTCKGAKPICGQKTCPANACTHPAVDDGRCCPSCKQCLFRGQIFADKEEFSDSNDPCKQCFCSEGNVTCVTVECPPTDCKHPVKERNTCCPICRKAGAPCSFWNEEYLHGSEFKHPQHKCKDCWCDDGNVYCKETECPTPMCEKPLQGACCPICDGCVYKGQVYEDDSVFTDPSDPYVECSCSKSLVACRDLVCPRVNCTHPVIIYGERCPTCLDCEFEGESYKDGVPFTHPNDTCKVCRCDYPEVTCIAPPCPPTSCLHPAMGGCCPVCDSCMYHNQTWENGAEFDDATDDCGMCKCHDGSVRCSRRTCPRTTCTHPVHDSCCKTCDNCLFEGEQIPNGESFVDANDLCRTCTCEHGNIKCHHKLCSVAMCSHPGLTDCCETCDRCQYGGLEVLNGETFADPSNKCLTCECQNGSVTCKPIECQTVTCSNPVWGRCCQECNSCFFGDHEYQDGEKFLNPDNECQECRCNEGTVECTRKSCLPVSCPKPKRGPCCLECERSCRYAGQTYEHNTTFLNPYNECEDCNCRDGVVECFKRKCPVVRCTHPTQGKCCQTCDSGCVYHEEIYDIGTSIPNPDDKCETCTCIGGDMQCNKRDCPTLSCSSTYLPAGECCPVCSNVCLYNDVAYEDEETWTSPEDPCQLCTCRQGYTDCIHKPCPSCTNPKIVVGECCPLCGNCIVNDNEIENGTEFTSECEHCLCHNGNVTCTPIVCPEPACENAVKLPGKCCSECPSCKLDGKIYEDGESFPNPSDRCQDCSCHGTEVRCHRRPCTSHCLHPIPDKCCPVCDGCYYRKETYFNGEVFSPEMCQTCTCNNGSVTCSQDTCEELTCLHRTLDAGSCCERCRGCVNNKHEYDDGDTWISLENPCLECTCDGGVTTCARQQCETPPCANPIHNDSLCCPVCPGCTYNNIQYEESSVFETSADPCVTCRCEFGSIQCSRKVCPLLMNCSLDQILLPKEGECCPACISREVSLCSEGNYGIVSIPEGDPCFTCACSSMNGWLCQRNECPELVNCPDSEIFSPNGSCCPSCRLCYSDENDKYFEDGTMWTSKSDPCEINTCDKGVILKTQRICPTMLNCGKDEKQHHLTTECCDTCVHKSNLTCYHNGQTYGAGVLWQADPCTSCLCIEGDIKCTSLTCKPLICSKDEVPYLYPGVCCPRCIPKPITCVAFGDPHYRTFDGNMVHFQGTCRYVMAADCVTGNFTVEVMNSDRGYHGSIAWTESVTIKMAGSVYHLLRDGTARINGEITPLPYLSDPSVYVENSGNTIMLTTNVGMQVLWNGDSYIEVSIAPSYQTKMCGLCGNYNSYPPDDLRMRSGEITTSAAVFGNSWKVPDPTPCRDAVDLDPCVQSGYSARKLATTKCAIIRGPLFRPCHRHISPEPFFASCVYDLCACSDTEGCLCDILGTYVLECAQVGVVLDWRSKLLCSRKCTEDKGLLWNECSPPCHRTCANKHVPVARLRQECYKPCVPGCQCPDHLVRHQDRCIAPSECPV